VDANSGSHLPATFGAAAASIRAIFHLTDPLTIRCAMCADLGAEATGAFVKFRADQHDGADVRQISAQAMIKLKCLGSAC